MVGAISSAASPARRPLRRGPAPLRPARTASGAAASSTTQRPAPSRRGPPRAAPHLLPHLLPPPAPSVFAPASSAAASARRSTAPTSGVSLPRTTTIPSSSTQVWTARDSCRRRSSTCSAARSTRRQVRTTCSTCAAVPARATSSSACSVAGVATRVTARTFEGSRRRAAAPRSAAAASPGRGRCVVGAPSRGRRCRREADAPAQPVGAGGEALPAAALVELGIRTSSS